MLMLHTPAGGAQMVEGHMSHSERDKAVVSLDVPLEDFGARTQHALKAWPIQLHALEGTPGDYGGGPGTVQQQGNFTWMRENNQHVAPNFDPQTLNTNSMRNGAKGPKSVQLSDKLKES